MNKLMLIGVMFVMAAVAAVTLYNLSQKPVAEPVNLADFQKDVALMAGTLNAEVLPENVDWLEILAPLSEQYQLDISIRQSTPRLLDIAVHDVAYEDLVSVCAALYASGLRFQSVRLLNSDQPGLVKAETLVFIR